jgi:hypothetical protein
MIFFIHQFNFLSKFKSSTIFIGLSEVKHGTPNVLLPQMDAHIHHTLKRAKLTEVQPMFAKLSVDTGTSFKTVLTALQ